MGGRHIFSLSNNIKSIQDIKKLIVIGSAFLVVFLLNYRTMMQETYSENLATLDFGYGRNNVAFTALLFSILFEFLYYTKLLKSYVLLGIIIMAVIIVFCSSRYAMMMLVISFYYSDSYHTRKYMDPRYLQFHY